MIKLSKTSKMPCQSWSIPAGGKYCPGSKDAEVCEDCYAQKNFYNMPVVKNSRAHNAEDWKRDEWVTQMVRLIKHEPYFRWFDSGDLYHPELAHKILQVLLDTRDTLHWLPTKMHGINGMSHWLTRLNQHKNMTVRWSSKTVNKVMPSYTHKTTSVVLSRGVYWSDALPEVFRCPAPTQDHKCGDCRACWDKTVQTVGYLLS